MPLTGTAIVKRVGDFALYDVTVSMGRAMLLVRPDVDSSFFSAPIVGCSSAGLSFSWSKYAYKGTVDGYDVFGIEDEASGNSAKMYLTSDKEKKLAKEEFVINNGGSTFGVSFVYHDDIDTDFSNDNDKLFTLSTAEGVCTNAGVPVEAKTSEMCKPPSIPENMCSVCAIGKASATVMGQYNEFVCKMIRVDDYVRYFIYNDAEMTSLFGTVIVRPDLQKWFYFISYTMLNTCTTVDSNPLLKSSYKFNDTDGDFDSFVLSGSEQNAMFFNSYNHMLTKEVVVIPLLGGIPIYVEYKSVDYSYEVEDTEVFTFDHSNCPDAAKANEGKTSVFCRAPAPSSSSDGPAPTVSSSTSSNSSSSSSSASFSLPSVVLVLIALLFVLFF